MLDSRQETPGDVAGLRRGLEAADPAILLLSLVQLTGERHWLEYLAAWPVEPAPSAMPAAQGLSATVVETTEIYIDSSSIRE